MENKVMVNFEVMKIHLGFDKKEASKYWDVVYTNALEFKQEGKQLEILNGINRWLANRSGVDLIPDLTMQQMAVRYEAEIAKLNIKESN
jgi:hypothetical protein